MRLNKLNGWQRLWIATCVFTLIPILIMWMPSGDSEFLLGFLVVWALLMVLLYIAGLVIKWVVNGFMSKEK
jgi:hypothetical protein